MKKWALLAATLICFAGCARNDTDEMTQDATDTSTAVGTPAAIESESSMSVDTNSWSTDTNSLSADTNASSSTLNLDTNNVGQPALPQSTESSTLPPAPPAQAQPPQQGQPPQQPY